MNKISDRIKYWLQIFLIPVYWISFLTPRSRKIWVLGSTFGRRYADNARYFYLYLDEFEKKSIRPIWISRKKEIVRFLKENGKEAYYVRSIKGVYYCLRAKVYIFDNYSKDICFWLSGGARKVNLWHGAGNKATNFDNRFDYLRHPRNFREYISTAITRMSNEKPSHYILATSPTYRDIFASAFQVPKEHIIIEGYPRNVAMLNENIDKLLTGAEEKNLQIITGHKNKGEKVVVYMPTFRNTETMFFDVVNLEKFNIFLREKNIFFMTKMHPKSNAKKEFQRVEFTNIYNIDSDVDPYTFLEDVDMLVTDYSSVFSDFSLLNRPTIIFPFDYKEYSSGTRDEYVPFNEYIKVTKVYSQAELEKSMERLLEKDTDYEGRKWLLERTFSSQDEESSKRLCEKIKEII